MIYLLANQKAKQDAINYILTLPDDGKYEVVVQEYIRNRTAAQNRLYWMWIPYLGSHFGYSKDGMHDELKYAFLGTEEYTNHKTGVIRKKPKSSKKLKVKPMVEYLTKIEVLANANDIILPIPHDYSLAMMRD